MVTKIHLLTTEGTINWPNACARCCRKSPNQMVHAGIAKDVSSLLDAAVGTTHYKTRSFSYPVCESHALLAKFSTWLTRKSPLPSLLRWYGYLIGIPAIPLFALKLVTVVAGFLIATPAPKAQNYQTQEPFFLMMLVFGAAIFLVLTVISYFNVPIRIFKLQDDSVWIRIASNRYANHFETMNEEIVLEKQD
jgi:hypothetical protein